MLGDSRGKVGWPACGEIDIMEFVGHTPDKTHATLHWRKDGKHASNGKALTVSKPWEDFHVYAVEWTADTMDFYFDDTKVHSFEVKQAEDNGGNPFQRPQYLLINLALGGSWGGAIDDAIFPQRYEIDYVRVYQQPAG
jgi:beta-glucanase (GH16 family)